MPTSPANLLDISYNVQHTPHRRMPPLRKPPSRGLSHDPPPRVRTRANSHVIRDGFPFMAYVRVTPHPDAFHLIDPVLGECGVYCELSSHRTPPLEHTAEKQLSDSLCSAVSLGPHRTAFSRGLHVPPSDQCSNLERGKYTNCTSQQHFGYRRFCVAHGPRVSEAPLTDQLTRCLGRGD